MKKVLTFFRDGANSRSQITKALVLVALLVVFVTRTFPIALLLLYTLSQSEIRFERRARSYITKALVRRWPPLRRLSISSSSTVISFRPLEKSAPVILSFTTSIKLLSLGRAFFPDCSFDSWKFLAFASTIWNGIATAILIEFRLIYSIKSLIRECLQIF